MTITEVGAALRRVLGERADALAREVGFVRRQRKLSGSRFVRALVFGWLAEPEATLGVLAGVAGQQGAAISRQGLAQRFGRPVVAFGPIGYFRPECWPEHDPAIYAEYLRKITCYVAWLAQQGCAIVFIPGETHYDQLVIDDLRAALCAQGVDLNKHVLPATIENVDDLLAQLAGADMLVASRFHNILLGLMLGKPAIALSYQAKIDALMADVGMADYCRPIAQFDLAWLQASFTAIMHNRAALAERIEQREAGYRAALEEQYERIFS